MHLSVNQTYPWVLHLSDDELTVLQLVLRGDELDEDNESLADHLSHTLDKIRPLAERTREKRERARERVRGSRDGSRRREDTPVLDGLDSGNGTSRIKLST